MKKWIALWSVFFCYMLCVLPVRADLIWEPMDSFYEEFSSECEYVGRTFTANGPDGEVILYESPVSGKVITRWENGFTAYISFTYEDRKGTVWGVYEDGNSSKTGWMPMEYMDVVYDSISFAEEYQADFREQKGVLDEQYLGESVCFWPYPGASEGYKIKPESMGSYMPEYYRIYEDSQGRTWGNVGYYFGLKDVWVCLDQPDAAFETLYPDGNSGIGEAQPQEKEFAGERISPGGNGNNPVVMVVMAVALVVLVTGILLLMLKRKSGK